MAMGIAMFEWVESIGAAARRAPLNCGGKRSWRDKGMAVSINKDNPPAIKAATDVGTIDVNKVDSQLNASLARKVRILVERHPQAALTLIRNGCTRAPIPYGSMNP
ncbi:MAG TPA: hypothetical protein QF509_08960 [Rhodospirillales bacterium]|jgi:hypothetical protein|nr:hypothetical protein [Rhodospirillales bacterium]